jgi:hypothetical protein
VQDLKSRLKSKINLDNGKVESLLAGDDFDDAKSIKKEFTHYISEIDNNLLLIDEMNSGIKLKVDNNTHITTENNYNVQICLFHAFYFMLAFSIVLPTNIVLIGSFGEDFTLTGLVLAFTPLGIIFSTFISNLILEKTYKKPLLFGSVIVVISSFLYILSNPLESMVCLCASRFVLGLGSAQLVNKNYIVHFVPRKKVQTYLLYLQIASLAGLSAGPMINMLVFLLTQAVSNVYEGTAWFNVMVNPVWVVVFLGLILILAILRFYTEPIQNSFTIATEVIQEPNPASLNKEIISREERKMIDRLDEILKEINNKNQFSDTNLVARNIEQIAWKENKTSSYIYKCFIVFISVLVVVRVSNNILTLDDN